MILVAGVGDQFEFSSYQNLTTMLFASQNGAQTNRWSSWSHRELLFLFVSSSVLCFKGHRLLLVKSLFRIWFTFSFLHSSFFFYISQVLFSSNISSIVFLNLYWFFIFIRVYTCHLKEKENTMTTIIKVQYL